jgi:mannose-6-phosphate isomerase
MRPGEGQGKLASMDPLDNRIQEYAWGSTTAIAALLGRPSPAPRPQAELWMGAHPSASSSVWRDGSWRSLVEVIGERPDEELGPEVHARFGARLPFLFKVLAAETPLSLQAHPSPDQAMAGYDAEDRAGIALHAPERNYKDRSHKPELLCALTPFNALSGFRPVEETMRLFSLLGVEKLERAAAGLAQPAKEAGLRQLFFWLMSQGGEERARLVGATLAACTRLRDAEGPFARECDWAVHIGALYPGDVGVVVALLLNSVRLSPGEALYLPAGQLHAYLGGVGIEIMANSDNVLRAGLTPKHVDVPELLRVLEFTDWPAVRLTPQATGLESVYLTPAPEFRLSRIALAAGATFRAETRRGPEILLCTEGDAVVHSGAEGTHGIARGGSVFVSATEPTYRLTGAGTLFRACVGD